MVITVFAYFKRLLNQNVYLKIIKRFTCLQYYTPKRCMYTYSRYIVVFRIVSFYIIVVFGKPYCLNHQMYQTYSLICAEVYSTFHSSDRQRSCITYLNNVQTIFKENMKKQI